MTALPRAVVALEATEARDAKRSQATVLVNMARQRFELGISTDGDPYAVAISGPRLARLLRGGRSSLRAELAAVYLEQTDSAASSPALSTAIETLEGFARRAAPIELHLRVAQADGCVWLDLGREDGQCVRISPAGWAITTASPVLYRREPMTAPMPLPARGGDVDALRRLLVLEDRVWRLVIGWMVGAMFPSIPRPVLLLTGEQGSAKSVTTRMLAGIIDPAIPQTRCAPREERDWIAATSCSALVALDNLSNVADWLSDAICRAVTGEGYVRRRLFSDGDVAVTTFRRTIIANGIDLQAYRGDLLDRSIIVELPRISEERRRPEAELVREYERMRPAILAGLLDMVAAVLRELPTTVVERPPRMADYAHVLAALDHATGWQTLSAYMGAGRDALSTAVEADHVARAVAGLLEHAASWSGTASELLDRLNGLRGDERPPQGWPTTPQHLSGRLRRAAPSLRAAGHRIDDGQRHGGKAVWTLEKGGFPSSPPSPGKSDGARAPAGGDDGDDEIPTLFNPSAARAEVEI